MKLSPTIAAASLSCLFAINAGAEQYHGVLRFKSIASRAEIQAEADAASHAPDPFREGAYANVARVPVGQLDKASVHAQALNATRTGNPFGDSAGAGVASVSPSAVDRQAVRAEARAAAASGAIEALQ